MGAHGVMENIRKAFYTSPIGILEVRGTDDTVVAVHFTPRRRAETSEWTPALAACLRQLAEYFSGTRKVFTVSLRPQGTEFQRRVWKAVSEVACGTTTTYGRLAEGVGRPSACRAVGAANGRNPISILIPCHRVVGSGGKLVGYGGGLWRKEWLLAHERRYAGPSGALFKGGNGPGP